VTLVELQSDFLDSFSTLAVDDQVSDLLLEIFQLTVVNQLGLCKDPDNIKLCITRIPNFD
jgi:hypothetical protein